MEEQSRPGSAQWRPAVARLGTWELRHAPTTGLAGLIAALGLLGCDSGDVASTNMPGAGNSVSSGDVEPAESSAPGGPSSTGELEPSRPEPSAAEPSPSEPNPSGPGAMATEAGGGEPAEGVEPHAYEVQVDPYGNCPLTAVVNVHGVEPSEVVALSVVVAGQDGAPDFERQYSPTDTDFVAQLDSADLTFSEPGHHVPILGLYADRDNAVHVRAELRDGSDVEISLNIETELSRPDEPAWAPSIQVTTAMADLMEPGWTVAEMSIEPDPPPPIVFVDWTRTIAFDERGAIRWALRPELPLGETFTVTRSLDGNFLTGSFDTIVELNKLGRTLRSFQIAGYSLHHEILQIGGQDAGHASTRDDSEYHGNLLVLASRDDASTIQDQILELDPESGAIVGVWDLATVLDPDRTTYIDPERWAPGVGDWLHANGLAYSSLDESIIVSGRHQGVAKIRRDGTLVWLLAPHAGWNEPQADKLLTAVDAALSPYDEAVQLGDESVGDATASEFGWAFGQHSPALLPNGDLLLFDNGSSRHWGRICGGFSRAVIYRIDETEMTVRQIGHFVLGSTETSCFVSNTHLLPVTGNIFIQPGSAYFDTGRSITIVKEVATQTADDGTIAFDDVVFDATLDMSVIPAGSAPYSYRGHRWVF